MQNRLGKVARYFLLTLSVLGIAVALFGLYLVLRPPDSLGEADDNCARQDFPAVGNGNGMVATSHLIDCTYFMAHGEETTFVYLHKSGEKDSRNALVFRFANVGNLHKPLITWSDEANLHIFVSEVGEVTKQVSTIDGVKILYSIGKEDAPAGETQRIMSRTAKILAVSLIFLIGIFMLTLRSILRQKNNAVPTSNASGLG